MKTHDEILAELEKNADHLREIVDRIPEPLISERLEADKWSVKEILCHLVDIQNVGTARIGRMLKETDPVIEIYDEERENRERKHQHANVSDAAAVFLSTRGALISELKNRHDEDWQRTGQHPEQERFTIEFILNDMLDHENKHFEQIAAMPNQLARIAPDH